MLYAFDVKVFGVTVYKFFDRYSRLRAVHQNMNSAGCLDGFPLEFPKKSYFTDHDQQVRGQQPLTHHGQRGAEQIRERCWDGVGVGVRMPRWLPILSRCHVGQPN